MSLTFFNVRREEKAAEEKAKAENANTVCEEKAAEEKAKAENANTVCEEKAAEVEPKPKMRSNRRQK